MRLESKIALITGAGSGIGRATALRFATEGAHVIVNDVSEENGEKTVAEIKANGGRASFFHADVTIPESVQALTEYAIQEFKQIDILFNNVGISNVGR